MARHYCLRCFGDMPPDMVECPTCDFHNLPSLRRCFWNRSPMLVDFEKVLKAVVIFLVAGTWFCLYMILGELGSYIYWIPAIPFFLGVLVWITVSKLTRHGQYFKCSMMWTLLFLVGGGVILLLGERVIGLFLLLLSPAMYCFGRWFLEWK